MVGHELAHLGSRLKPPFRHELSEQLGVMQDFEGPAEVRIFVPECIEAVGAVRHDLPDPLAPECLHVVFGEGLEQVLMPQSPSRIPRASLLGPRIANGTAAFCSTRTTARLIRFARSSNEPAHPTQYTYSGAGPSSRIRTPRPLAQSARVDCSAPHGFEALSRLRSKSAASCGNRDSPITRFRRMSTM